MQQQPVYKLKATNINHPVQKVGKSFAVPLQDNRPKSIIQKKQLAALSRVVQKKSNNTGLPDNLKNGVENLSGIAMDDVKVHYNSAKPAQLNALAYAQGTDIHVAPGQEKHLPHEAWHVVQQKQGRVKPTLQMKASVPVNDDKGLELEADIMGRKALQLKARIGNLRTASVSSDIAQRVGDEDESEQDGHFIVNDSKAISENQVHKTDFLNALCSSVTGVADEVLAKVHQTSANCPYIAYWFSHYETQTPAYIEKALNRYAPGAFAADSWQDCMQAVSLRVKTAFQNHVATGTLGGVPEGIPKDLIEGEMPEKPTTVQLKEDVTQLCCGDDRKGGRETSSGNSDVPLETIATGSPRGEDVVALDDSPRRGPVTIVPGTNEPIALTTTHTTELATLASAHSISALQHSGGHVVSSSSSSSSGMAHAPVSGERTRREGSDGPFLNTKYDQMMRPWLEKMSGLILGKHYRQAYDILTDKTQARALQIGLELHESGHDAEKAALDNMSFASRAVIKICVPKNSSWVDDPDIASRVLPMYLEEYMHQYQARRNTFMSARTGAFKSTGKMKDMSEPGISIDDLDNRADYDEIDVMAQMHDWGFNVEEIGYVNRYDERKAFWEWLKSQHH